MADPFQIYQQGHPTQNQEYRVWPLYGAGMENLGCNGKMINIPMPDCGPNELIIRHDACGLCFSDVKVIRAGQSHPRIHRDMREDPVVLGHEVALTIVKVGSNLQDRFQQGNRFILQADIYVDGINKSYGYEIQGGLSEYNKIGQSIIDGNYLIPLNPNTGYAESALVEPWACVIAAYTLTYRDSIKQGGTAWLIGPEPNRCFSISEGFDKKSHPDRLILSQMEGAFSKSLRKQAHDLGVEVIESEVVPGIDNQNPQFTCDDIILLSPSAKLIEKASPYLADHGVMVVASEGPLKSPVQLDVGRIHYNRWLFIGGDEGDLAKLYHNREIRTSELTANGKVLFVGAGGPMGRMHVQRAIENEVKPAVIVCSDVSDQRLAHLTASFKANARNKGIEWVCVNPSRETDHAAKMKPFKSAGFDDIIILAPIPQAISQSIELLANGGVMNIFAGIPRGSLAEIDFNPILTKDVRLIGHSGSSIGDMTFMLEKVESGCLETNRSVAAIGSLEAVPAGLQAVQDGRFPGKILIYPQIRPLPLTGLDELRLVLPEVYAKLENGSTWTNEAEQALFRKMLPAT